MTDIDPVCGMIVKPESPHASDVVDVHYRFCSAKCKAKFDADPQHYLQPREPVETAPGTEYV